MNTKVENKKNVGNDTIHSVSHSTAYEYGIMSNKHKLKAKNKLTAYATMVLQYSNNPNMIAIYSPENCKKDSWMNMDGTTDKKLNTIFGGDGKFEEYLKNNTDEIRECYKTVEKIV